MTAVSWVPLPSGYRMIGSGDVVPVFDSLDEPHFLILNDDGSVSWAHEPPSEVG